MKPETPKQHLARLLKDGWDPKDAEQAVAERQEWEERDRLRSKMKRLDALDNTECGQHRDSAHWNALDTCEEEGLPRDDESLTYMVAYIATLTDALDSAGLLPPFQYQQPQP